jgi:hypothetical protein
MATVKMSKLISELNGIIDKIDSVNATISRNNVAQESDIPTVDTNNLKEMVSEARSMDVDELLYWIESAYRYLETANGYLIQQGKL